MKKIILVLILVSGLFAVIEPTIEGSRYDTVSKGSPRYFAIVSATNGKSDWVLVPKDIERITATIFLSSNLARIEYSVVPMPLLTNSSYTNYWLAWTPGDVSVSTDSETSPYGS